jgi:hypothetical protein
MKRCRIAGWEGHGPPGQVERSEFLGSRQPASLPVALAQARERSPSRSGLLRGRHEIARPWRFIHGLAIFGSESWESNAPFSFL